MKRKIKILAMFIFMLMLVFPDVCFAEEKIADYQSQLDEYDLSSFDLLDDDTASLLDELGIDDFDYENISSISFKQIIDYISSVFSKNAQGPLRCCLILICFIILSSIVKSFDMHLSSDSVSDMYATVSNLVIAIFLVTQIYPSMKLACSAIKLCSDFTYAFFPAFCIICATSGSAMTSFSVNGSLLLFSQALNFISSNVFLPIVNSFMGISVCSSIRRDLNMGSIVSALRNLITKAISALSAIFVSYLSLKTAVASRADALGLRSVRFAINSVVPIIGSSISEGLLSIQSYSSLIKTSVGIVGIIAISAIFLPAIINITLWRLSISAANICSKVFFDSESSTVLEAFSSVLLIINVLLILSMVTTIISLGILVASKTVNV
jgi:stage III sporulation protein AE